MSGYASPDHPEQRLSDRERDEAVGRLSAAQAEGRLTPDEYGERAAAARRAVTWADLAPLFADLPDSAPAERQVPGVGAVPNVGFTPPPATPAGTVADPVPSGNRALGGRTGATIMALTPFVALALFFVFGFAFGWGWSWLWFLLIPVVGIVVYGPGSDDRRSRD